MKNIKNIILASIMSIVIFITITIPIFAIGDVSVLRGIPAETSISLQWIKASASTGTRLVYNTTDYPAHTSDGTVAYGGGTFTDGTGSATGSPITLHPQLNLVDVIGLGTFTIVLPEGTTGTAESDVCSILNSPVSLVGGTNTISTLGIIGNIDITLDSSSDSFIIPNLDSGTPYYIAAWGWNGAIYSATAATLLMNTSILSEIESGDDIPAWTIPSNWNQTPVAANLDNMAPLTNIVSDFWASWQFPTDNGFLLGWCVLTTFIGIFVYVKTKEIFIGLIVCEFILVIGVFALGIPSWMLVIPLCFGGGIWAVERYLQ